MIVQYNFEMRKRCIDIFYNVYHDFPYNFSWLKKEDIEKYFIDLENTPKFIGFVYIENERTLGVCFGIYNDYFLNSKYYIKEIFVEKNYQGCGIGTKMMKEIETNLKEKNINVIELLTPKKLDAYSYYISNGFSDKNDMVYMLKLL